MEWTDEGIALGTRKGGRSGVTLSAFTREHGLCAGFVRNGQSASTDSLLQTGNLLQLTWSARLDEHLGQFRPELLKPFSASLFHLPEAGLALLTQITFLGSLPPRQPFAKLFDETLRLLQNMSMHRPDDWIGDYLHWEVMFLAQTGFGLDFSRCAVSGERKNLTHVSPNTGRAVTNKVAAPYGSKLLPLPSFLCAPKKRTEKQPLPQDILQGAKLTGHFLHRYLHETGRFSMPASRGLLLEKICTRFGFLE